VLQIKTFTSRKKIKIDAVVQKYHVVVQYCQIGSFQKVALLHQYMELKNFFNKKASISSILKVPFIKNIYDMTQCLQNPGFRSIKV